MAGDWAYHLRAASAADYSQNRLNRANGMHSKVSGLLSEALAPEIQAHVHEARLEVDFRNVFATMTDVNQAHVVMLSECAILAPDIA